MLLRQFTKDELETAQNLCPRKIGTKLLYLAEFHIVIKIGHNVTKSEADAMRIVKLNTEVPVPQVHNFWLDENGRGCLSMSFMSGQPLAKVWTALADTHVRRISEQLSRFVRSWRAIRGEYFGSFDRGPCKDIFFSHLPFGIGLQQEYGPFDTRQDFNHGLASALRRSRPGEILSKADQQLERDLYQYQSPDAIFTHGDLNLSNILVDDDANITAILDWGEAGYSTGIRELFEAQQRSRDKKWLNLTAIAIPGGDDCEREFLYKFNRELCVYTGL